MKQKGQSLLEGIIAIFVIIVGVIGALILALAAFSSSVESEDQVKATNFAREGLEVIRNQRDSNWLAQVDFDYGFRDPDPDSPIYHNVIVQFNDNFTWSIEPKDSGYNNPFNCEGGTHSCQLFFDSSNSYYNHTDTGSPTNFYRVIQLNDICLLSTPPNNLYIQPDGQLCIGEDYYKRGIQVLSKVVWLEGGQERSLVLEDRFYNWR